MVNLLFSFALFLSATLLFVIQPIVAKSILPVYGGTPAVWTICMLFFQCLLLAGYGYAWFLSRNERIWRFIHGGLIGLTLLFLPVYFVAHLNYKFPELALLYNMLKQFGLPILVLAASAPLLQFAYSLTQAKRAHDPYFLYVASNAGSLIALLSYPVAVERLLGLKQQYYLWNILFILYLIVLGCLLIFINYAKKTVIIATQSTPVSWRTYLQWLFYAFVPCSLMLGITAYITTDIAATPLLWVIPFALYLISFIITFSVKPIISRAWLSRNILFFLIFPLLAFIFGANWLGIQAILGFHLINFFMFAVLCHGELAYQRPSVEHLTTFYVCIALGGVLAGIFNAGAPYIFNGAYEYPISLVLACLCMPWPYRLRLTKLTLGMMLLIILAVGLKYYPSLAWLNKYHVLEVLFLIGIVLQPKSRLNLCLSVSLLMVFLLYSLNPINTILTQQRNFFGVKQVSTLVDAHILISQNTLHGFQIMNHQKSLSGGLAYYGSLLPVTSYLKQEKKPLQVIILGLGTGLLSCQFDGQDQVRMVDIDPQVIEIAKNPRYFTYLRDCPAQISTILGDARLIMQQQAMKYFDLLVIDAFSSDAIPTHLVTQEAFKLYSEKIKDKGVIAINLSNRHIDLVPVITANGRNLDHIVLVKNDPGNPKEGQFPALWAILTTNERLANYLMSQYGWRFVTAGSSVSWTDDYSNILPLLKW